MATITPVAFWTGSTIPGTTQIGNLSVGTTGQDYGTVGTENGITYWATPDQDLGYIIAHDDLSASHTGNTVVGGIQTKVPGQKVGFFRSTTKNEESFLELTNTLFNQNFTGGTDAKTWLNNNGYWTSFTPSTPYTDLETISVYLRNYMSEFRNPNFYNYWLDGNGYEIGDGGGDMYDNGNISSPWIVAGTDYYSSTNGYSPITYPFAVNYTNSATTANLDTSFGYISLGYQQYPGGAQPNTYLPLTVLGSRDFTTYGDGLPIGFQTAGNSGADGGGTLASGFIYTGNTVNGFTVHAFYRETYNASDPSHCDLYILLGHPNWDSVFGSVSSYAQPTNVGGCGGYLYTSGSGVKNILAIKTLLSKNSGQLVTLAECQTVVNNFIARIKEALNF